MELPTFFSDKRFVIGLLVVIVVLAGLWYMNKGKVGELFKNKVTKSSSKASKAIAPSGKASKASKTDDEYADEIKKLSADIEREFKSI